MLSGSVVCNSDSMDCRPNRLCPWNSPGKNTRVGCHFLPQGSSDPGVESMSLLSPVLAGGFLTTEPPGKPLSKLSRFLGCTVSIDKNCHNFAMPWIFFFWHYHLQALILFLFYLLVILWRRKWQPTPVFLPRESHGQRRLVGCCP